MSDGHTHNKTTTCSTESKKCPGYYDIYGSSVEEVKCSICGHHDKIGKIGDRCPGYITSYNCGSPINTWKLGCGKREDTIESVIITFY